MVNDHVQPFLDGFGLFQENNDSCQKEKNVLGIV